MTDQLDDFLEQEIDEITEPEAEATEAEVIEAEPETVVEEEAPTAPEENTNTAPETVPLSALMGVKSELKEAKAQIEALQKPKEEIDIFDNPDGYKKEVLNDAQLIALNAKFETSEMLMQDKHEDYDEKAAKFEDMVKSDPSLYNQMVSNRNPAKFIYDHVVKSEKMAEIDNIDDYKASLREQIKAEVMAELKAENKPDLPPSMVDARSSSAPKNADANVSLDDILN